MTTHHKQEMELSSSTTPNSRHGSVPIGPFRQTDLEEFTGKSARQSNGKDELQALSVPEVPGASIVPGRTGRYSVTVVSDPDLWLEEMFLRGEKKRFCAIVDISNAKSPGLAAKMWEHNLEEMGFKGNREESKTSIAKYRRDADSGEWWLTPEPVMFDWERSVANGQGRIKAAMGATGSMVVTVWFGCEVEEFDHVDQGRNRSVSQILRKEGYPVAANLQTMARMSLAYDTNPATRRTAPTEPEHLERAKQIANRSCPAYIPQEYKRRPIKGYDIEKVTDFVSYCVAKAKDYVTKPKKDTKTREDVPGTGGPAGKVRWIRPAAVQYAFYQCGLYLEACIQSPDVEARHADARKLHNFVTDLLYMPLSKDERSGGPKNINKLNKILTNPDYSPGRNGWDERRYENWVVGCIERVFMRYPKTTVMTDEEIIGNGIPPFYYR